MTAAKDQARVTTSPPHCLRRVCVGLRTLCVALGHFALVYVQFMLVYVGLCSVCVGLCWLCDRLESLCARKSMILASSRVQSPVWLDPKPNTAFRGPGQVLRTVCSEFMLVCARFASLCVTLSWFMFSLCWFMLVYVGLCWFGQTGTQTDSKEQDPSFLTTVPWGGGGPSPP